MQAIATCFVLWTGSLATAGQKRLVSNIDKVMLLIVLKALKSEPRQTQCGLAVMLWLVRGHHTSFAA